MKQLHQGADALSASFGRPDRVDEGLYREPNADSTTTPAP